MTIPAKPKPRLVLDIETIPCSDEHLRKFLPPPPQRIPFDPDSVKVGNLKDANKIAAKIEDARIAHESAQDAAEAQEEDFANLKDKATLKAATSRIFAVGLQTGRDGGVVLQHPDPSEDEERKILQAIWERIENTVEQYGRVYGWNVGFDISFIWQRSLILGVTPSVIPTQPIWYNDWLVDLQGVWTLDPKNYCKLNHCALALGLEPKVDLHGRLPWQVCMEDEQACFEYTKRDMELTWQVMEKLCP